MILVVGATGRLGSQITRKLLDAGKEVRVLVRPSSSYEFLDWPHVNAVQGDLKDRDSLVAACAGANAIVTTANATARGGEDTTDSVDRAGNQNLIDAAGAQGVERFLFISALGADPNSPMPLLQAKGETEQRLRASGMSWTVLQPNLYMDILVPMAVGVPALAGEPVTLVGEGARRHSMVAMRDVVAYAVAALERPDAAGRTLVIGGPQSVSWGDVVAAFERELGRALSVRFVPPGDVIPSMPEFASQLLAALETYDSELDTTQLAEEFSVTATPLDEFVKGFVMASRNAVG
jgi:uncharacterized protein YbjT (DUF2867 family)